MFNWINLPDLSAQGNQLLLSLKRRISCCLTKKVKFKATQSTHELCFYTNLKEKTNKFMKSYGAYQFCYPGCNLKYADKNEQHLYLPLKENAINEESFQPHL